MAAEFDLYTETIFLNPNHPQKQEVDSLIGRGVLTGNEVKAKIKVDESIQPIFLPLDPKDPKLSDEQLKDIKRTISFYVPKGAKPIGQTKLP